MTLQSLIASVSLIQIIHPDSLFFNCRSGTDPISLLNLVAVVLFLLGANSSKKPPIDAHLLEEHSCQFFSDPITCRNDRALGFFKERRPNSNRWVAIWDQYLIRKLQSINQSVNFYSGLSDRSHFEDHYVYWESDKIPPVLLTTFVCNIFLWDKMVSFLNETFRVLPIRPGNKVNLSHSQVIVILSTTQSETISISNYSPAIDLPMTFAMRPVITQIYLPRPKVIRAKAIDHFIGDCATTVKMENQLSPIC